MRYSLLAAAIILADQATKHWVRQALPVGASRPVIPGVVHLTHVQNTGAAFGLFRGYTWFLIIVTAVVFALTLFNRSRIASERPFLRLGYALGLAGAIGNLIDRVRFGRVTDFIDVMVWPVFNLADSAIVIGVILLFWGIVTEKDAPGEKEPSSDE